MTAEDEARLTAITERTRAASDWTPDNCEVMTYHDEDVEHHFAHQGATIGDTFITMGDTYEGGGEDWNFLAHVRQDVPWLLKQIEVLREQLGPYRKD